VHSIIRTRMAGELYATEASVSADFAADSCVWAHRTRPTECYDDSHGFETQSVDAVGRKISALVKRGHRYWLTVTSVHLRTRTFAIGASMSPKCHNQTSHVVLAKKKKSRQ
jgi:hypothetical protein